MDKTRNSQRTAYGEELAALGRENADIVVLEADLGKSTMSCLFGAEFPDRYFEMGIAEAIAAEQVLALLATPEVSNAQSTIQFGHRAIT